MVYLLDILVFFYCGYFGLVNSELLIRLANGTSECSGRPEIYVKPYGFIPMCSLYSADIESTAICEYLGMYGGYVVNGYFGRGNATKMYDEVRACTPEGGGQFTEDCLLNFTHSHSWHGPPAIVDSCQAAGIICSCDPMIRLVNGTDSCSGRLEVYMEPYGWGTVCPSFGETGAQVACRQLGFTGGTIEPAGYYGNGSLPPVMTAVRCSGNESCLLDCSHYTNEYYGCRPGNPASISCDCNNGGNSDTIPFARCEALKDMPSSRKEPNIISIYPEYGPLSGGTRVSILGSYLNPLMVDMILFGPDKDLQVIEGTEIKLVFVSPKGNSLTTIDIGISYHNTETLNTGLKFTYKPDPVVSKIYPLESIVSGGTKLTVEGSNLNSVANPKLDVTLTSKQQAEDKRYVQSECDRESVTYDKMLCLTPDTELDNPEEISTYDVYIGLTLDGVPTYKNVSETLPEYGKLVVYQDPILMELDDAINIKEGELLLITIKGKNMNKGCTINDYRVDIGEDICTIRQLADNLLTFEAPTKNPKRSLLESIDKMNSDEHYIFVSVGNSVDHKLGIIRYETRRLMYIIIGVCAGIALLVIIGSVAACICIRRKYRKKERGEGGIGN